MISLVYVSSAVQLLTDAELTALLEQSRAKNSRLGLTGMLLYKDGNFIQVLEGPEDAVQSLFQTICRDERHRGVIQLLERPISEREFADWSMGFYNLQDPSLRDIPGYSEFMNEPLTSEKYRTNPNYARRLLEIFRRNMDS